MRPATRGLLCAGYVAVTFLAFPHPIGDRVLDLGCVLAWGSPALLLLALGGLSPARAGQIAFAAAFAAHALILHWIYIVTVVYGGAPPIAGVLGPAGLGAYAAAFTGALGAAWAWLDRRGSASPFAAAALWAALDHLRSFALSGFPWATLGYAQHHNPALLALAPYTGVYGLSFVTVLGGAALARVVVDARARRRPGPSAWAALATVAIVHAAGLGVGAADDAESGLETVRVAVLQGNIDQGVKWSPARAGAILDVYEDLTRRAAADGARIVVWPETAVPGGIDPDAPPAPRLAALARETGALLVLGAVGLEYDGGPRPARFYDSAFLLGPAGGFAGRYDKAHLVPFGEYVPLRDLLGRVFVAIARGMATVGVTPGDGPRALDFAVPGSASKRVSAGVPICYELLFPDLMRRFVDDGAQVLFAITNDAWYGRTGAPYQFLAITALRSAESRVWTARAANTGVSAIIDARGRIRSQTRIFERARLVADLPLRPAPIGGSFYTRYGDVFAWGCWAGAAVLGLRAFSRGRSARSGPARRKRAARHE
ncbi:MAG: apolipoprotein N-acyltransferase [Myxococcales bacterium]|nr:apolipoprotein N-acyltransferase [Myxococcales bacterium]